MKSFFIICVFWLTTSTSIEAVPNDYEQRLLSRSIGDLPIINWFYGNNPEKSELDKIDDAIKVEPVENLGPDDKAEPIENLLEDLKQKAKETNDDEENKNISTLLTDLNKTMAETSTHLAKVFINNTWRIFDIGVKGTSRRTRNINEAGTLLTLYYMLLDLISRLLIGLHLGGNLQGSEHFKLPSIDQKLIGGIAGPSAGDASIHGNPPRGEIIEDPSRDCFTLKSKATNDQYVFCIDNDNELKANQIFSGETNDDIINQIKIYLKVDDLNSEYKWYIILKLYTMVKDLEKPDKIDKKDEDTKHEIINLIVMIGKDPKFEDVLTSIKTKNDPRFLDIWKLLKNEKREPNNEAKSPVGSQNGGVVEKGAPHVHIPRKIVYDANGIPDISKTDWSIWTEECESVLKNTEALAKNPEIPPQAKWNLIDFVHRWYLADNINPGMKSKLDGLVKIIKEDPKFNETFDYIKQKSDPVSAKQIFDTFGKEYKNPQVEKKPSCNHRPISKPGNSNLAQAHPVQKKTDSNVDYSTTTMSDSYYWDDKFNMPKDDAIQAKMALSDKTDALIDFYTKGFTTHLTDPESQKAKNQALAVVDNNRKEFASFENVFLPQLYIPNSFKGDSNEFTVNMLRNFRDFLGSTNYTAKGKIYSNGEERRIIQSFIESKKKSGEVLPIQNPF